MLAPACLHTVGVSFYINVCVCLRVCQEYGLWLTLWEPRPLAERAVDLAGPGRALKPLCGSPQLSLGCQPVSDSHQVSIHQNATLGGLQHEKQDNIIKSYCWQPCQGHDRFRATVGNWGMGIYPCDVFSLCHSPMINGSQVMVAAGPRQHSAEWHLFENKSKSASGF